MYQEVEGQKPVIVSRNHNTRVRPPVYRWTQPPDWNPAWNFQSSMLAGLTMGISSAFYLQLHNPMRDLLKFYQAPDNLPQLRIFMKEVMKMENFRTGLPTNIVFLSAYGAAFQGSRFWLWKTFAGGHPHNKSYVDYAWIKTMITAISVATVTCWIPVPFHNIKIRYDQDRILPKEHARGYRNHIHAALSILKNDGPFPLMRSSGPIMGEFGLQTFGLLFWMDFTKDKFRATRDFGQDFPGFPVSYRRVITTSLAVYVGLLHGYPFKSMRLWVETLPMNSKSERAFNTYAEVFWKGMGDNYNGFHLWNGFHRYLIRAGPPLWLTVWFADSIGIFDQPEFDAVYVPAEE